MDAFRQKRSMISTADRSTGGRALREGNRRVQKQRNYPTFASDASSSSSGITDDDPLMFDLGWRSSNQAAGTPMKKLLAKEMTQETEHRRRSQSVIARLMGLEGLPPQQPPQKQQQMRRAEENRSATKVEKSERSSPFSSRRSSRKSSREEQEFKDVFEVVETPKFRKSGHRTAKSNITEGEMQFIRQKFMEAKRLSTDDKLKDSKEFHDTLEVLDSNRDLLLKFLQQPDSLFTKHLHDLHGAPLNSRCGRVTSVESSFPHEHASKSLRQKSEREKIAKSCDKSFQKHRTGFSSHSRGSSAPHFLKPSMLQEKVESDILPTRIVVLKPNLGKTHYAATCVSSPSHALLSNSSSNSEFSSSRCEDKEPLGNEKWPENVDLNFKSRGSRKVAKEVTREMKNVFDSGSVNSRGCSGDETSSTVSGNDSVDESDITILTSRKPLYCNHQRKPSWSSGESSVTREAEAVRRLSRRWRMSHKSREIGEVSRGSTLADMLALTDRDPRHQNMEARRVQHEYCEKLTREYASSSAVREPLGISSRDGWKDAFVRGLSKSRSVPTSSDFLGSPKTNLRIESPRNCRYTVPTEVMKWEKNKKVRGHTDRTDGSVPRKLKPRKADNSQYSRFTRGESSNSSSEIHLRQNQAKPGFEEKGLFPKSPVVSKASASNALENMSDLENENVYLSPEPTHLGPCAPFIAKVSSSQDASDGLATKKPSDQPSKECPERAETEIVSPASSKEPDQPSPVSTLEAPFTDDVSSGSECFESLCADLHGLRMQLRLLKLESEESYGAEGSLSDEDAGEGSTGSSPRDPFHHTEETWESSYITDVLVDSGYNNLDPDMFMTNLHSLECPVNPSVFEQLEKSYCGTKGPSRPERRLLFDRVNSGLVEIYQQLSDPHPWVGPRFRAEKDEIGLIDGLRKSLLIRERKVKVTDHAITSESKWLYLGDNIDLIGREIERLVMDDMVAEAVVIML